MKNLLLFCIFCLSVLFTFNISNAYTPSLELEKKLEDAVVIFEGIISKKGENYRQKFLDILNKYQEDYNHNERAEYILGFLYTELQNNTVSTKKEPNILLIIADDMGLDASPGYTEGTTKALMPNLENMIKNGLIFENFWTAPTCTPTRSTMLTGKYGIHTGVLAVDDPLSLSEKPLQSYLPSNYSHAVIGKWHLSKDPHHPNDIGIDYYAGLLTGGVKDYSNWTFTDNGKQTQSNEYITSKFTDLAIDWTQKQENPWFLWLAYTAPHTPFHLPPNELHSSDNLDPSQQAIDKNPLPYYMAMLESLDTEIGRLLSSMSQEERNNTLIIFMGDNGTPGQVAQNPYEKRKAKGSLYQGGINTPLIISGAGVSRTGEREVALINSSDIFSTILDITNTGISQMHDSQSFAHFLTSTSGNTREYIYGEVSDTPQSGHTIRDNTYKYMKLDNGREFLFDLSSDPYEENNLIKKDSDNILDTLQKQLSEIRK